MTHTQCKDTVISQVKSPDAKFIATAYHRSCAGGSGRYTCAKIEEAPRSFWSSAGETGYVMTVQGYYSANVTWQIRRIWK